MTETDEGVLDPWVAEWVTANVAMMEQPDEYTPEYLEMARPAGCPFPTYEMAKVTDEAVEGVPVRIYEHNEPPTGLVVYFHGGGFCTGSIGLMENIANRDRPSRRCCGGIRRLSPDPGRPVPSGP